MNPHSVIDITDFRFQVSLYPLKTHLRLVSIFDCNPLKSFHRSSKAVAFSVAILQGLFSFFVPV